MTSKPATSSRSSLSSFAKENGIFLTLQKACGAGLRRTRDSFLARRLGIRDLRIGKHPRLAGLNHIRLGENFSAGDGLWLEAIAYFAGQDYTPALDIGRNCNLSDQVHIACINRVTIDEGLLCGSRVIISDHGHGAYSGSDQSHPNQRPVERRLTSNGTVTIGRNVWIGDGVAILAGAQIGDGAVIGANSVVTGSIPSNTIAAGAPARIIRCWDEVAGTWSPLQPGVDKL
jgi:lipopolysaccharide O-acetyltransferase